MDENDHSSNQVVLPRAFENAPRDTIVELLADVLFRIMNHNDQVALRPESLTRFHARSAPSFSVLDYLNRIVKYIKVENACLLMTLLYIDRFTNRMPLFIFSSLTCHRFLIVSIAVSTKCNSDVFSANALYAKVGGLGIAEFNMLERDFLSTIQWELTTTKDVLDEYYFNLVRTHSLGSFVMESSPEGGSDIEIDPESDQEHSLGRLRRGSSTPAASLPQASIAQNVAFAELQQSLSGQNRV